MDVEESWLFMIMKFIEKIVYNWDGIYWFVIVWINGCWNCNVFIVMEVLVKIYVNGLWYIWIENCDDK